MFEKAFEGEENLKQITFDCEAGGFFCYYHAPELNQKLFTEEIEQLDNEIHSLSEQSRILNQVMKKGYMDSALFMEKNNLLSHRLTECRRKKTLLARRHKRTKEIVRTEQLIGLLKQEGYQREFREELFDMAIKEIRISPDHEISFCLKNGLVLTEKEGGSEDAVAYTNRV